jgi:tellurite resistance protein TerA
MALFGFGKNKDDSQPASSQSGSSSAPSAPASSGGINLGKQSGKIDLTKGARVTIEKTPIIRATAQWSSNTDYDLYALVLLRDGRELVVSTFGSSDQPTPTPSVLNGAVRHLGDVGRVPGGNAQEVIEIKMTDEIVAVVPVAYSAQSNGTGSFKQYKVSLGIDNGAGTQVNISADDASRNPLVYSLAIGVIRNTADGVVIEHLEKYSKISSEKRPAFRNGEIVMDAGAKNLYK